MSALASLVNVDCPVGTYHSDHMGAIIYADQEYCDIVGLVLDDIVGTLFSESVYHEDIERVFSARQTCNGKPKAVNYRYKDASGNLRIFTETIENVDDSSGINIKSIVTDLTPSLNPVSIERFMASWYQRPEKELAHYLGAICGRMCHNNLHEFHLSFGASMFAKHRMCERIDFLYNSLTINAGTIKRECFEKKFVLCHIDEVIAIESRTAEFDKLRIMVLKGQDESNAMHYSIRPFVQTRNEHKPVLVQDLWDEIEHPTFEQVLKRASEGSLLLCGNSKFRYMYDRHFWNFRREIPITNLEGVIVYPEQGAFSNHRHTITISRMVGSITNLMGFF